MKRIFIPLKGILVALLFICTNVISAQTTATMRAFPEGCGGGIGASVDSMSFRISFTNNGMEAVTSVTVVDELPAGLDASGVTLRRGQPSTPSILLAGNTLTFTFTGIELAAGATGTLDYDVPFDPSGLSDGASLNNFATVTLGGEAAVNTDTTANTFATTADVPVFEIGNDIVDEDPSNGFDPIGFNVMPTGGAPPYSYEWRANGDFLTSQPSPTITPLIYLVLDLFVTDANGCVGHDQLFVLPDTVEIPNAELAGNNCAISNSIDSLFGQEIGVTQTSMAFNNTGYSTSELDPDFGQECFFNSELAFTMWFSFTGDGETYEIKTNSEGLVDPLQFSDASMAIYSGACTALTAVACNEDENFNANILNPLIVLSTEIGVEYKVLIDGTRFGIQDGMGAFQFLVTRQIDVEVAEITQTEIDVYPNPTNGLLQLAGVQAEEVAVIDFSGRTVLTRVNPGNQLDISALPAGVYTLLITDADQRYSARVIKE